MQGKLYISHCFGQSSHNGYLVHTSKVGSIIAGYVGVYLAREKVSSEMCSHRCLDSKQIPLIVTESSGHKIAFALS